MSRSNPEELYERAQQYAAGARPRDAERLILRALRALAARAGTPGAPPREQGAARAADRSSIESLLPAGPPLPMGDQLVQRLLTTLAYLRAELGSLDDGLAILDDLAARADPELAGRIVGQRGVLFLRAGRLSQALPFMDEASRLLRRESPDRANLLLNRGLLHMNCRKFGAARKDFQECQRISESIPEDDPRAETLHDLGHEAMYNLGYLSYLQGDLPGALRAMDASISRMALAGSAGTEYVNHVDRARVLATAGLLSEADEALAVASEHLRGGGRWQDLAEVELTRAEVAMDAERLDDAGRHASRAERIFERRGSEVGALLAALMGARIRLRRPGRSGKGIDPDRMLELSAELQRHGLRGDSQMAGIAAVEALVRRGEIDRATALLPELARTDSRNPITTRLAARAVRAHVAQAHRNWPLAAAERRAGLRDLHRYQASFGSLDLQTAVSLHGVPLAEEGLAQAVHGGTPAQVLAWVEQGRSLASRLPPVCPPQDPRAAQLLAGLRSLRGYLRKLELQGGRDKQSQRDGAALRRQARDLERRIRQRSWYASGPGQVRRPVGLTEVRAALAERGPGTLVAHVLVSDRIHALIVSCDRARTVALGPVAPVLQALRRVRADLDVLAVSGLPEPLRRTVLRSLRTGLGTIDAACWRPLGVEGDGPVVLVPAGALVAVPWACLQGLDGRPVTVARSATAWVRGRTTLPPEPRAVSVSGPDLQRAQEEACAVADLWPGATALHGPRATGEAVIEALSRVDLLHLAAHGMHEAANPLFSVLHLAEGPLFGHDLARLPRVPGHVVLAACDLGLATQRPGDELLGTAAVLLQAGSGSVIASVARVGDDRALDFCVAYHRGLRSGRAPAQALAEAATDRFPVPFVCFGAGW
ncbi:MAG: hypothetical protein QG608_2137 [Actinomycetota bacterium]|nr:hypothetical protein [Actinomycetota bacterium]